MAFRILKKSITKEKAIDLGNQCEVVEKLTYHQKKKHIVPKRFFMSLPSKKYFNIPLHIAYKNGFVHSDFPWAKTNDLYFKEGRKICTLNKKSKDFKDFVGEFREYQEDIIEEALDFLKEFCTVTLSLPPGWGKTMASLYLSWKLGLRTIVLLSIKTLLPSWKESISKFLPNFRVWVVGEKYVKNPDIILCMDKRVKKIPEDLLSTIGTLICDEVHLLCSIGRVNKLLSITPKYAIMLSATVKKINGFEQMCYHIAGEHSIYRISTKPYDVHIVDTNFSVDEEHGKDGVKISRMRQEISRNTTSQDIVLNILMMNCNYYKTMCLRMVKEGIPEFVDRVKDCGITCDSMYGNKNNISDVQCYVGTQQKCGTGMDLQTMLKNSRKDPMNTYYNPLPVNLVLYEQTTPNEDIYEQGRGRAMRSDNPVVIILRYLNKASQRHVRELLPWLKKTNATVHFSDYHDLVLPRYDKIYKRVFSKSTYYKTITEDQYEEYRHLKLIEKTDKECNKIGYTVYKDKAKAIEKRKKNEMFIIKLEKLCVEKKTRKGNTKYYCISPICDFNIEYLKKINKKYLL